MLRNLRLVVALAIAICCLPIIQVSAGIVIPKMPDRFQIYKPASTTTASSFVLQNLGVTTATAVVDYWNSAGTNTRSVSGISIAAGAAANFDQRYSGNGDPGTNPFVGSTIASSDQPLGSVVNLIRSSTSGGVTSVEAYNGLGSAEIGTSVRVLQVLKGVNSGGLQYNTSIAIQNSDVANSNPITLTFTPDPVTCAALGCTAGSPFTVNYTIPAGGSYNLDQSTQSGSIGTLFFGSVLVASTRPVAVVTVTSGGEQVLLAEPAYTAGSTTPMAAPSIYKNIVSLGDSYSTACIVANMGASTASFTVQYIPASGAYTVSGTDVFTVPVNSIRNIDQRYNAPSITSATFLGAAIVTPTNGVPIATMCNLRGGTNYAMTYGALTAGATTVFLPVGYKYITSGGVSYSSTYVVYNFGASSANVTINYFPNSGTGNVSMGPYAIAAHGVQQFDLRYHASTSSYGTFFGAAKLTSDQPIGVIVQSRGSGVPGDYLFAYRGLAP